MDGTSSTHQEPSDVRESEARLDLHRTMPDYPLSTMAMNTVSGGRDPDNRRPTRFGADRTAAEHDVYRTVAQLDDCEDVCLPFGQLKSN